MSGRGDTLGMRDDRSDDRAGGGSLGQLLRSVATDVRMLIQGEVALARAETSESISRLTSALIAVVGGTLIAFVGLIVLAFALVDALSAYMAPWQAALIVGGGLALIGAIMVTVGAKSLQPSRLMPNRTAASLSKDFDVVKERAA